MGKTELAFSLGDIPVIYVPLAQFQLVYKAFAFLNEAFIEAASKDLATLHAKKQPSTAATQLSTIEPFYCCGLVVALIETLFSQLISKSPSSSEKTSSYCKKSLDICSAYHEELQFSYRPMSISAA
jgi:hypothetical protein